MDALGGPGVIVQIDDSFFRHKPKISEYNSEDKVLGLICNDGAQVLQVNVKILQIRM